MTTKVLPSCLAVWVAGSCASLDRVATQGTTTWWDRTGASACGTPAVYRIDGGPLQYAGDCAGYLIDPPAKVALRIGEVLDVHVVEEASGSNGSQLIPIYPTPSSSDTSVLEVTSVSDAGSTESLQVVGAGSAWVVTTGSCVLPTTAIAVDVHCPVLLVVVP
jgi:hypothetical protein